MIKEDINLSCPVPVNDGSKIQLGHGSGGVLTNNLIKNIFLKHFNNDYLRELHDGAALEINGQRIAFTTDSYVVNPLFFPGGNIGDLAINGTVNDLAMCGAKPQFISAGLIIEEGFGINELEIIVRSMKAAAESAGVLIVTGDTKVVEKGKGDKVFINTAGIGVIKDNVSISPKRVCPGDKIILSGSIAEHGIAILLARESLRFRNAIKSDTAPLNFLVEDILSVCSNVHVFRDPTRGGLAGALNEIASSAGVTVLINEDKISVHDDVDSACEILGLDPLYIANEGKLICFVPGDMAETVLEKMKQNPLAADAEIIGEVRDLSKGRVIMKTVIGTQRTIGLLTGEQLPRIC